MDKRKRLFLVLLSFASAGAFLVPLSHAHVEEVISRPQEASWLPWAMLYYFSVSVAACAALFASALHWSKTPHPQRKDAALLIALLCAIAALLALLVETHQSASIWQLYTHPAPPSWMSWGALLLPLFALFLSLWGAAQWATRFFNKRYAVTKWLAVICAILAPGLLFYSGLEISLTQSHPVWFSYAFTLMMFLSALQTFFALMLASTRITLPQQRRMAQWQSLTLIVLALLVTVWVSSDSLSGTAIRQWLETSSSALYCLIGLLALWFISICFGIYALHNPLRLPVRAVLALSAMALHWVLLIQAQSLPRFKSLPTSSDSWLVNPGAFDRYLLF